MKRRGESGEGGGEVMGWKVVLVGVVGVLLFGVNVGYGAVEIPLRSVVGILLGAESSRSSWASIVWEVRLPGALVSALGGAGLSVSGLLLQTLFRNPLAGPSILGISEGANLGVGVVVLLLGGTLGYAGVLVGAMVGSAGVLLVLVYYSERVRNYMTLLIVGLMVGYLSGSVLAVLTYRASPEAVRGMLLWGLGHFGGVSRSEVWLLGLLVGVGLLGSLGLMKPLNAVVLGESYASNLGIQMRYVRRSILLITGLLTGSVTAFCGPVSFIGLAVPHMTRMVFRTSNQQVLVPGVMLVGSGVGLLCNLLTEVLGGKGGVLPLNAVTPMVGVPVVIYITMRTFGGSKKD